MALTQEEVVRHQSKQADLKNFIEVLTPLCSAKADVPADMQNKAQKLMNEMLDQISIGIPESIIKKIT